MSSVQILVADSDSGFRDSVKKILLAKPDFMLVGETESGLELFTFLKAFPDAVLIMDLFLCDEDGISVMQKLYASGEYKRRLIFVVSSCPQAIYQKIAHDLGIKFYMLKPVSLELLFERISRNISINKKINSYPVQKEYRIIKFLLDLDTPPAVKGFYYLREALIMMDKNPECNKLITKMIYPEIAKKYDVSGASVEKAIRNAIFLTWKKYCESDKSNELAASFFENGNLSNSVFLDKAHERLS